MNRRMTLRPVGPRALLVEFPELGHVRDYYGEAQRRQREGTLAGDIEVVPGARTILFDELDDIAAMARDLNSWQPEPVRATATRERIIPTVYDGPDLPDVASAWGMTVAEVVDLHLTSEHEVVFLGFAPGFAYIGGLPEGRPVPRRDRPRTRVPAGSVALAAQFTGVYPRDTPGGWQLIGRTTVPLWDPAVEPASYLLPGDRVRFTWVRP